MKEREFEWGRLIEYISTVYVVNHQCQLAVDHWMEHQLATLSTSFNYINIHMWRWLGSRQHVQTWVIFKDIKGRSHRGRNGDTCASWKDTFDMFGRLFFCPDPRNKHCSYMYIYIYWHVICTHTDKVSTSLSCHHLSDSYQFRCSAFGYGSCTFNVTVVRQKDLTFSMHAPKNKNIHICFTPGKRRGAIKRVQGGAKWQLCWAGKLFFFFSFMPEVQNSYHVHLFPNHKKKQ